jgi:hypothetical protein
MQKWMRGFTLPIQKSSTKILEIPIMTNLTYNYTSIPAELNAVPLNEVLTDNC